MPLPAFHSNPAITLPLIEHRTSLAPSRLGEILAAPRKPRTFTEWLIDACELFVRKPTWCDYLAVHKLSEFPETAAPLSRSDEPLFARGKWKRVKVKRVDTPLRKFRTSSYLLVQFQALTPFAYQVVSHEALPTAVATIQDKEIREVYNLEKNSPVYRKPSPWINLSSNGMSRPGEMPRLLRNYCPNCTEITIDDSKEACATFHVGCYLPKEHECPMVRVYNPDGVLLETRSLLEIRSPHRPAKSVLRAKPVNKDEVVREVAARRRLKTEMHMVATRHPYAPYEARSLNGIMRESRTFPN